MDARPLGKMVKTAVDWDGTQWLPEAVLFKWREPATARSCHAWVTSHMPPGVGSLTNCGAAHQTEQHSNVHHWMAGKSPQDIWGAGGVGWLPTFGPGSPSTTVLDRPVGLGAGPSRSSRSQYVRVFCTALRIQRFAFLETGAVAMLTAGPHSNGQDRAARALHSGHSTRRSLPHTTRQSFALWGKGTPRRGGRQGSPRARADLQHSTVVLSRCSEGSCAQGATHGSLQ